MAVGMEKIDEMPVVKDLKDFDQRSGNLLGAADLQQPDGGDDRLR